MSTHMAYGFVTSYLLALLTTIVFPWVSPVTLPATASLALAGLVGGAFPDVDQLEFWGPPSIRKYFVHKKTLHYPFGYLIVSIVFVVLAGSIYSYAFSFLTLACACFGAWVHSIMDPLDGWRDDHPDQGIYEHLTRRWIASRRLIMFAGMWEWVVQALVTVGFIAISANLSQLVFSGWKIATATYFGIWAVSAGFDVVHSAPQRQLRERDLIRTFKGLR